MLASIVSGAATTQNKSDRFTVLKSKDQSNLISHVYTTFYDFFFFLNLKIKRVKSTRYKITKYGSALHSPQSTVTTLRSTLYALRALRSTLYTSTPSLTSTRDKRSSTSPACKVYLENRQICMSSE